MHPVFLLSLSFILILSYVAYQFTKNHSIKRELGIPWYYTLISWDIGNSPRHRYYWYKQVVAEPDTVAGIPLIPLLPIPVYWKVLITEYKSANRASPTTYELYQAYIYKRCVQKTLWAFNYNLKIQYKETNVAINCCSKRTKKIFSLRKELLKVKSTF